MEMRYDSIPFSRFDQGGDPLEARKIVQIRFSAIAILLIAFLALQAAAAQAKPAAPAGACFDPSTLIHDVQGDGGSSPIVGSIVEIEGVVVGDYQSTSTGLSGFFIQEEDADADGDGDSDGADFLTWQRQLGAGGPVAAAGIPEPATVELALFAITGPLTYRCRKKPC